MGFFDKLFKKKEEKKEEAPAAKPKAEPASTSASFKAEPAPAKPAEAPKTEAPKAEGGNPDPYAFIVPPVASPGDADVPKDAILPAADLGPLLPGAPAGGKIKLAVYWTAACGGCDVSLLDTHERLLTIGDMAEIVMWPVAADGKEKDIAAMEDGEITVALINGAIRNSENEHMAKLLRQKSKTEPAPCSAEAPPWPTWFPEEPRRSWTTSTPRPRPPPTSRPTTTRTPP